MSALSWFKMQRGLYTTKPYSPHGARLPRLYRARQEEHHAPWWTLEGTMPGTSLDAAPRHWVMIGYHRTLRDAKAAAEQHVHTYPESEISA